MVYRHMNFGAAVLALALGASARILTPTTRKTGGGDGFGFGNIQVANLDDSTQFNEDRTQIIYENPDSDFAQTMFCKKSLGTKFTFSADGKWVGCCLPGQTLEGSPETAFDCCGAGHKLVGSKATGYRCCPSGEDWDGEKCKRTAPVCQNGKSLVDGKCVCPPGTVETAGGACEPQDVPSPDPDCPSGVTAGKCYLFKMANGEYLGYNNNGYYSASKPSNSFQPGKFKLCKDQSCAPGTPVNPGDPVRIQDLHGQANSGKDPNNWLNGAQNGGHIGKTADYPSAGVFTITKWTSGKHCLGGVESGVGPTCPSNDPAITFNTMDQESCVPVQLESVPCTIRDVGNNCLWTENQQSFPVGHDCVPVGAGTGSGTGISCPPGCPLGFQCVPVGSDDGGGGGGNDNHHGEGGGNIWMPTCPPGQSWKTGKCLLPITDCADRAHPEFGDTSYNPADFPCSSSIPGRTQPCRGEQLLGWSRAQLNWVHPNHWQPEPPQPVDIPVNYDFDIMMTIVDIEAQSEHFLLKLDGEFFGETGGETEYRNVYDGYNMDPEWCLKRGYTRGYFRIPKGKHTITVEWPKGTGRYKYPNGVTPWSYGVANYRFDKLCDPDNCPPDCVAQKQEEAEKARQKLAQKGGRQHDGL